MADIIPINSSLREEKKKYWLSLHEHLPPSFFDLDKIEFQSDFSPEEKQLVEAWDEGQDEFGFFVTGDTGVGKTFVLQKLCIRVINSSLNHDSSPSELVLYFPMGILIHNLRSTFHSSDFDRCISKQFLFLDDLGSEYATDFAKENLFTILDTRLIKKLPTFITSNLSLIEIKEKYGERISSRIKQLCVIIKINGKDRRTEIFKERIQTLKARGK